jgi:NADH:ubiquinone oxidoreductase subunit B-like Fe-S oxidoreductase
MLLDYDYLQAQTSVQNSVTTVQSYVTTVQKISLKQCKRRLYWLRKYGVCCFIEMEKTLP